MKLIKYLSIILVSSILSINLAIAEKWDMALAYGAGNFHSANAAEFAKNVTEKSGGKLTIVTHPGVQSGAVTISNDGMDWTIPFPSIRRAKLLAQEDQLVDLNNQ